MNLTSPPTPGKLRKLWQQSRGEDRADRTTLVVMAAMGLLRKGGLAAVSMRAVADRLGVGTMTLYTYVTGQDELQREMMRAGFEWLRDSCDAKSTLGTDDEWRGGARQYIQFALDHPNLYELMFRTPIANDADAHILENGIQPLLDKVRDRLIAEYEADTSAPDGGEGTPSRQRKASDCESSDCERALTSKTRVLAGRFWIALHGLATLAIAGRLCVLEGGLDQILDDLLGSVAPTTSKLNRGRLNTSD